MKLSTCLFLIISISAVAGNALREPQARIAKADKDSAEGGDVSVRTDCDDYTLHLIYHKKEDCFEYDDDHEACEDAKDAFEDSDAMKCTDDGSGDDHSVKLDVHYNVDQECFDKGKCEGDEDDEDICDDAWDELEDNDITCDEFDKDFDEDEDEDSDDDDDDDDSDDEDSDDEDDEDDSKDEDDEDDSKDEAPPDAGVATEPPTPPPSPPPTPLPTPQV